MDYLKNIVHKCPSGAVLLGLDVGKKTIGVAVCEPSTGLVTPFCTIQRKKFSLDIKEIERISREFSVGGYVIGYPINMDGSEGARCQSIRDFAIEFQKQISEEFKVDGEVFVALWDERLSTFSVEDFVDKTACIKKRKAKESGLTDKLAATLILQGAVDYIRDQADRAR